MIANEPPNAAMTQTSIRLYKPIADGQLPNESNTMPGMPKVITLQIGYGIQNLRGGIFLEALWKNKRASTPF